MGIFCGPIWPKAKGKFFVGQGGGFPNEKESIFRTCFYVGQTISGKEQFSRMNFVGVFERVLFEGNVTKGKGQVLENKTV